MMRLGTAGEAVYREHPIKILRYSAKNLWLLIFPLLRSLRFYPFSLQKLIDWGAGAWFDLLVALLILGIGTLRWHACTYYFDEVSIRSQSGILLRRGTEIPLERIASTVEEHPFYLRPLRAACLQISTAAGAVPEADMHLTLYLRDLHRLRQHIPVLQNGSTGAVAYHTPAWRMLLFSALFSSSFSGAIYIATICFQGGRITSDLVKQFQAQQILEDATDKASTAFHGVPRIAITIGIVILALWLISFGRNLLRYGRFRHAVRGGVHLGAHGNPHPPAVSSAGQRHYFPRPAAESADEDIRHGIPPHSLPRLRQPAGYAAGADSADSEKRLTGTIGKAAHGAGHGAPETSCTLQYPVFLVLCVAAGDRALCDSAGTVYSAVAAAESGGDHSVLFRDADYSAGVAAVYPHCGDVHRIGHHGRPVFADAFLQLVHVPHHYGEPRPHCPHGPDADTRTEDVRRLSSVYHL